MKYTINTINIVKKVNLSRKFATANRLREGDTPLSNKDYKITQLVPLKTHEDGGLSGGVVKLVNQKDYSLIYISNDLALRNPMWSASFRNVRIEAPTLEKLFKKLEKVI